MPLRPLVTICALAAALTAPAVAAAADAPVAADPAAGQVTALGGTVVWVSGEFGAQVLMQRTSAGIARVPGAATARSYSSIDLGRDARGRLVLTYVRCTSARTCVALRDDLRGHRARFAGLALRRCSLTTAPAVWGRRVAYGLECRKGAKPTFDAKRSGLYVKTGARAPKRLPLPRAAVRFGADEIRSVDLRGSRVAAVASDIYEYAFSQTVTGTRRGSFLAAASEGESDEHANGLALGPGATLWALVDAEHVGDPNQAIVHRVAGGCHDWQTLPNPPGSEQESGYRATDVAVDGNTLYLLVPGTGIVTHEYTPDRGCIPAS